MKRHYSITVISLFSLALGASLNATVIFTEDFEAVAIADGGFTSVWPTPTWTVSSGSDVSNVLDPTGSGNAWLDPVPAELGEQFGTLHSGGNATTDLAAVYQANSLYTLTFTNFRRDDEPGAPILVELMTTGGAVVTGTEFAAVTTTGTFETRTITFDTVANATFNGDTIRIRFTETDGGIPTDNQAGIDNISLAVVPEPSTLALIGLSGLALILRRRR